MERFLSRFTVRRIGGLTCVMLLAAALIVPTARAATVFVSESYKTDASLPKGALVSLKQNVGDQAELAELNNVDRLLGVVIDRSDASISFSNDGSNYAQVAKSGTLDVMASDINGSIEQGDYVTASVIRGVGMRAIGSTKVVGVAQDTLKNVSRQQVKAADGSEKTVSVGTVTVLISVSGYIEKSDNSFIPRPVQDIADTLAGRTVSALPILLSLGIFVVTLIIVTSIIYAMVRNGIISVGRNPLSSPAIYRNIIQLSVLVVGILVGAGVVIYFVLTRL